MIPTKRLSNPSPISQRTPHTTPFLSQDPAITMTDPILTDPTPPSDRLLSISTLRSHLIKLKDYIRSQDASTTITPISFPAQHPAPRNPDIPPLAELPTYTFKALLDHQYRPVFSLPVQLALYNIKHQTSGNQPPSIEFPRLWKRIVNELSCSAHLPNYMEQMMEVLGGFIDESLALERESAPVFKWKELARGAREQYALENSPFYPKHPVLRVDGGRGA
ncbi:hypothetical protein BDV95DRAFT_206136 [Massariosphaeria phaeospora]|uniref:Uncharacterized protein n=1 Tax=Massariosphaeria phaeospora TaxID=100035 RepID=A0A7C8HZI1_9PLEO|nr:hypothetical protein BDV95DRAFT_206136 [Massariosphaeria phaeospora]